MMGGNGLAMRAWEAGTISQQSAPPLCYLVNLVAS